MKELMQAHIHEVVGYSSARDEFSGTAEVFLDANENPYNNGFNRYPDSKQRAVRQRLAALRNVAVENIYIGNGSDSIVDQILRIFCTPGEDGILISTPTFAMYKVMAAVNNVHLYTVSKKDNYQLDLDAIKKAIAAHKPKIIFICSPNNPTGTRLHREDILEVISLHPGITIIDEAYADFDEPHTYIPEIHNNDRLIVMQTLSKSWGLAGIRIGACYAHPYIVDRLYAISTPYNVNIQAQEQAVKALDNPQKMHAQVAELLAEKDRLKVALDVSGLFEHIIPSAANFWVVKLEKHQELYDHLAGHGLIIRNLHKSMPHHLRLTIGKPEENNRLMELLEQWRIMR